MNVAIIGSGGREHSLVKALNQSSKVSQVFCIPGSDGISHEATCLAGDIMNTSSIIKILKAHDIKFVVIGPEAPLVSGLAGDLRENEFIVFGPNKEGADLEGSKIFSKHFMQKAGVPTARFKEAQNKTQALKVLDDFEFPVVVKADVLAAGKGVIICKDQKDYESALHKIFDQKVFGDTSVVIEEFISGWELSYIIVTDGENFEVCPLVQDHKALKDKGLGPNTGGMGVVGPIEIPEKLDHQIRSTIVQPTLTQLKSMGIDYRGALFIGLMIHKGQAYVLEYNVRFGDPETQIIFPLMKSDAFDVLYSAAQGKLNELEVKRAYAACVVLAAEGYPENPIKGSVIEGLNFEPLKDCYFIASGVKKSEEGYRVSGGRVLGAVAIAETMDQAINKSYELSEKVYWKGLQKRSDIGQFSPSYKNSV